MVSAAKKADYCKRGDPKGIHTVCQFECEYGVSCGNTQFHYLSNAEREIMLNKHNQIRNDVAEGKYESKNLEKAQNMQVLSYDKELEWIIGCWLKQCTYEPDDENCRANGAPCGQSLFWRSSTAPIKPDKAFLEEGIDEWFDGIKYISKDFFKLITQTFESTKEGEPIFSATQLIWANTRYVGCAKISYKEGSYYKWLVGCNYEPPGNIGIMPMYLPGEVSCRNKNGKYKSLCGEIRPMNLDSFKEPWSLGRNDNLLFKPKLLLICMNIVILLF